MMIPAVSSVTGVTPTGYVDPSRAAGAAGDGAFAGSLSTAIDGLAGLQADADRLAIKAVTGDLADIHQATIAATRAQVTLELIAAVRNKGVDAFNEIMRMQA